MLKPNIKTPRDFINPLLSKKSIKNADFDNFKKILDAYKTEIEAQHTSKQSEPNIVANALKPFVESFGYKTSVHSQKGQSGIDLTILKDGRPSVIIEAKKYQSPEMITKDRLDKRAFYEAVLYFMRERNAGNMAIFSIVITDFFNWFIFDAKDFEDLFWKNKIIKKLFDNYNSPSVLGDTTKDFYEGLERKFPKFIESLTEDKRIDCAYFNLKEPQSDKNLIAIYKLLSADSLLKEFNPNDANTLNKDFYSELLYILGLVEIKDGGKKIIQRAKSPQAGSLYENIADKLSQYHITPEFELIIKIMIVWVNRILFLKLLESQIVRWNDNKEYKFLNTDKIDDFDKLEMLFFEILAKRQEDRKHREFDYIPYLNSSLFELSEVEEKYLKISNLADDLTIAYYPKTVIKDDRLNRKTGNVKTLHYLFEFLDAYDFSSDSGDELASDNKALINASVLGLIFEKLNGYRDGSFYTPSFITMYMAKESITKAIIDKFNQIKGWNAKTITDIYNKIDDAKEANDIIDSMTICDPAVGSGHFLVSALNELLALKSELGILVDEHGKKIKDYTVTVENDELIIKDEYGDIFEYKRDSKEKTRIQKTLFKEKQKIIENSLFGVDINPNSVNICRLRLWIELLKNAYYKEDGKLDTLPNIDINIKCGNSLISRFGLTDELKIKNIKHEIEHYKRVVSDYKENLGSKKEVLKSIENLKDKFKLTLKAEWKVAQARNAKLKEYVSEYGYDGLNDDLVLIAIKNNYKQSGTLFGDIDEKKRLKLKKELIELQAKCDEIESGKIYDNAFEWRFEFPEVLDEKGDFVGFDVVIGNPPYFNIDTFGAGSPMLGYLPQNYPNVYMDKSDILFYFIARAIEVSKGQVAYIISNAMLVADKAKKLRNHILDNAPIEKIINFEKFQVFDEANITAMMIFMDKNHTGGAKVQNFKESTYDKGALLAQISQESEYIDVAFKKDDIFALVDDGISAINEKIDGKHPKLGELFHVGSGMQTAANDVFGFAEYPVQFEATYIKKRMSGEIIEKYTHKEPLEYLLYFENVEKFDELPQNIRDYLSQDESKKKLENRAEIKRNKSRDWWKYTFPMHKEFYHLPKIWCSYRAKENVFCMDESSDFIGLTNTTVIFGNNLNIDLRYILALLNSTLLNFRYKSIGKQTGSGVYEYFENQVSKIPIPEIDAKSQKPFIDKVDKILELKKSGGDTTELEREIDDMVYALYGLTDDEIAIVEGK